MIQSMLVAVCYVGLHCLLCWSSMLIVCYDSLLLILIKLLTRAVKQQQHHSYGQ